MDLTFEGVWYPASNQRTRLQDLMRRYQAAKQIAFKHLLEDHSRQGIVDHIRQIGLLSNARHVRSAIAEAKVNKRLNSLESPISLGRSWISSANRGFNYLPTLFRVLGGLGA